MVRKHVRYWYTAIRYGFKSKIIYRMSAWISSISGLTTFLIQVMVWKALLGNGARFDTSLEQMVTYLVVTQVAVSFVQSFSGDTIARLIKTGDIAIYLVRPIRLKNHLFLDDFGKNLFSVFCLNLPVCLLLSFSWGFVLPKDSLTVSLTVLMLINGMVILFHYRYILGLISFWMLKNPFTSWGVQNAESIFSGKVLPIWLCPAWLATLTRFLPFRYFTYEPVALFVGKTRPDDAWKILLVQFLWMALFCILEHVLSTRAMRRLIVQGG